MFELRPFQQTAIDDIRASIRRGKRRVILRVPTGGGKTIIASHLVAKTREQGNSALMVAPRRQLVLQASDKIGSAVDRHGVVMAGEPATHGLPVQIASKDTLYHRCIKASKQPAPSADLLIVDEAHLFASPSGAALLDFYPDAIIVGLSATPALPNGKGLGAYFDDIVEGPDVGHLIRDGYLVEPRYYGGARPDMEGVKTRDGDWITSEVAERADRAELIGDIVTNWLRLAAGRRTVVFCATVAHSRHVAEQFDAAGISAEHIDGSTDAETREAILGRVNSGETLVLCNCNVLTLGWDEPSISCCVIARPTKSIVLYHQMVGRALRLHEGKDDCIVIDHAGAVDMHGFVDEPVEWSLDGDTRVQDRQHERRVENAEPKPITCHACEFVYTRPTSSACPACGEERKQGSEAVTWADAELSEIQRDGKRNNKEWGWEDKHLFFGELLWICQERRCKRGWAAHKYKEKFGVWPNDPRVEGASPSEPSRETRAWVKSRDIAFFKSKGRKEAA